MGGQVQEGVWARPEGQWYFSPHFHGLELSHVPATTCKGDWEILPAICSVGEERCVCGDWWQYLPHEVINHHILFHACGRAMSILCPGMSV